MSSYLHNSYLNIFFTNNPLSWNDPGAQEFVSVFLAKLGEPDISSILEQASENKISDDSLFEFFKQDGLEKAGDEAETLGNVFTAKEGDFREFHGIPPEQALTGQQQKDLIRYIFTDPGDSERTFQTYRDAVFSGGFTRLAEVSESHHLSSPEALAKFLRSQVIPAFSAHIQTPEIAAAMEERGSIVDPRLLTAISDQLYPSELYQEPNSWAQEAGMFIGPASIAAAPVLGRLAMPVAASGTPLYYDYLDPNRPAALLARVAESHRHASQLFAERVNNFEAKNHDKPALVKLVRNVVQDYVARNNAFIQERTQEVGSGIRDDWERGTHDGSLENRTASMFLHNYKAFDDSDSRLHFLDGPERVRNIAITTAENATIGALNYAIVHPRTTIQAIRSSRPSLTGVVRSPSLFLNALKASRVFNIGIDTAYTVLDAKNNPDYIDNINNGMSAPEAFSLSALQTMARNSERMSARDFEAFANGGFMDVAASTVNIPLTMYTASGVVTAPFRIADSLMNATIGTATRLGILLTPEEDRHGTLQAARDYRDSLSSARAIEDEVSALQEVAAVSGDVRTQQIVAFATGNSSRRAQTILNLAQQMDNAGATDVSQWQDSQRGLFSTWTKPNAAFSIPVEVLSLATPEDVLRARGLAASTEDRLVETAFENFFRVLPRELQDPAARDAFVERYVSTENLLREQRTRLADLSRQTNWGRSASPEQIREIRALQQAYDDTKDSIRNEIDSRQLGPHLPSPALVNYQIGLKPNDPHYTEKINYSRSSPLLVAGFDHARGLPDFVRLEQRLGDVGLDKLFESYRRPELPVEGSEQRAFPDGFDFNSGMMDPDLGFRGHFEKMREFERSSADTQTPAPTSPETSQDSLAVPQSVSPISTPTNEFTFTPRNLPPVQPRTPPELPEQTSIPQAQQRTTPLSAVDSNPFSSREVTTDTGDPIYISSQGHHPYAQSSPPSAEWGEPWEILNPSINPTPETAALVAKPKATTPASRTTTPVTSPTQEPEVTTAPTPENSNIDYKQLGLLAGGGFAAGLGGYLWFRGREEEEEEEEDRQFSTKTL